MKEEIIIAGFGGQGVMSMGKMLAYAGMQEGKEVTWMPSYGPEMRGGTANCTVIVSDDKIFSPMSSQPDTIVVMNLPSLEKFETEVKKEGLLIINSSLAERPVSRTDIDVIEIPANDIASEIGNKRIANMVVMGAYLARKNIISVATIKKALPLILPERRHNLIPLNEKALARGAELINN